MFDKKVAKPIALAVGIALAGSFAAVEAASADTGASPFAMTTLSAAYMLGEGEGSCGGDKGGDEAEGSCGGDKAEGEETRAAGCKERRKGCRLDITPADQMDDSGLARTRSECRAGDGYWRAND